MPLYEYVCQKCGHKTEVLQRHGGRPPRACPECGGKVKKAFSAPAIQFKGSGFYLTDYGKSGGPESKTKSDTGPEKGESKPSDAAESSAKADSKKDAAPKSEGGKSESSKADTKKKAAKKAD
jgi:putative FmdB family regulatory protein